MSLWSIASLFPQEEKIFLIEKDNGIFWSFSQYCVDIKGKCSVQQDC